MLNLFFIILLFIIFQKNIYTIKRLEINFALSFKLILDQLNPNNIFQYSMIIPFYYFTIAK